MDDHLKTRNQIMEELAEARNRIAALTRSEAIHRSAEESLKSTLHELRVHQEELKTQNEDLIQARYALEISQKKYQHLFEFAPIGYFAIDQKMVVQEVNLTGASMLGLNQEHLNGKPLIIYADCKSRDILAAHFRGVFADKSASVEVQLTNGNDKQFPAVIQSTLVSGGSNEKNYSLTAVMDITHRKEMELALRQKTVKLKKTLTELKDTQEQILQQERLASVGQLAAGIAHDFNNILTGILGYIQLLGSNASMPDGFRKDLDELELLVTRAANLVRQILDFSRKSIGKLEKIDLLQLLQESIKFLKRTIPENIHILLQTEIMDAPVRADPSQFQQALTNLVVNARDAMPNGGKLRLQLIRVSLEKEDKPPFVGMQPGEWLKLSVNDNGSGIPEEIRTKIFDPFFTTKDAGKGSGLGLAQVYGIIRQHEGYVGVTGNVDSGTTFTIYLPLISAVEKTHNRKKDKKLIPRGRGETILLVEDEPVVLKTVQAMLSRLGYKVLTACHGKEAFSILNKNLNDIKLVLTDMVMPEMDGASLYKALQEVAPNMKVVMMTGYPLGEESPKILTENIKDWIPKPVSLSDLACTLNKILESSYEDGAGKL